MAAATGMTIPAVGNATARELYARDRRLASRMTTVASGVDWRTPEQKEADNEEAADGKEGRCAYSYDTHSYFCTQRGSV